MKRIISGIVIGLAVGWTTGTLLRDRGADRPAATAAHDHAAEAATVWTCSMHPQIRQPRPGLCPICGMALIPAADGAEANGQPRALTLSPAARALAEVAIAPVERRAVDVEVRMVGKVVVDETRSAFIATRVGGRIDRLYANFAGMRLKAGDHLADLYSPELVSAQQELLQAGKTAAGSSALASLLVSARERLRLWGLTPDQVAEIERSGKVRDHLTFYAPIGGILVEKEVREGMYVEAGMRLFTVADLSQVWIQLDAYESDLAWLRYAQEVAFTAEAYPGETFKGVVSFIDPVLDPMTRTVKVRVTVPNPEGRLKPQMFVRAVVKAAVTAEGRVAGRDLAGKWICPMHPEVVKDAAGACDVCGMPVVPAAELGYTRPGEADTLPLVIPETAPLLTGTRAVVYVAVPGEDGMYEGRDVELGPRAGAWYLVRSGLEEGERVVVNGAFKIDSSLQIQGKPSMMAPAAEAPPAAAAVPNIGTNAPVYAVPEAFRRQLDGVAGAVLAAGAALAADTPAEAAKAAGAAREALKAVDMALAEGEAHAAWMAVLEPLGKALEAMAAAKDLDPQRAAFDTVSAETIRAVRQFGPVREAPLYVVHCPMAFNDRGAVWLQADRDVRNPYFGSAMLNCGAVVETLGNAPAAEAHDHE